MQSAATTSHKALIGSPRRNAITPMAAAPSRATPIHKTLRSAAIARHCCGKCIVRQAAGTSSYYGLLYPELPDCRPPVWDEQHPTKYDNFINPRRGCDKATEVEESCVCEKN